MVHSLPLALALTEASTVSRNTSEVHGSFLASRITCEVHGSFLASRNTWEVHGSFLATGSGSD